MLLSLAVLAQTDPGGGLPLSGLGQLGAVGTILAIFLTFGYAAYKEQRNRADRNETEIARLNALMLEKATKWENGAEALADAVATLRDAVAVLRDRPGRRT